MSHSSFPLFAAQPGITIDCFQVTGANLTNGALGTAGLDSRGAALCTAMTDGVSLQTFVWNQNFIQPPAGFSATQWNPLVFLQPITDNAAGLLAMTINGFTITGETRDAHGTPLNNINWLIFVIGFNTTQTVN